MSLTIASLLRCHKVVTPEPESEQHLAHLVVE
jgi:hypothetical protein